MPRNRNLPLHLEYRRSGYTWRRRRPRGIVRLQTILGKPDMRTGTRGDCYCLNLHTHILPDAKTLSRRLTEMSDRIFAAAAEKTMAIAPEIADHLFVELAPFEIEAFEHARAVADPRSLEAAAFEARREEALQSTLRHALVLGDREVARAPLRHVAERLGVSLDESDPDWKTLAFRATRVLLDVSQERLRRQQGHYCEPSAHFLQPTRTESPSQPIRLAACIKPAIFATAQPLLATPPVSAFSQDPAHAGPDAPVILSMLSYLTLLFEEFVQVISSN